MITASFGTSGTIYACAEKPVVDPQGEIAAFCDSTNRWLPLLCTMNVTVATEMVREDFGWSYEKFAAEAARVPAGANGLVLLPYFEGERTPNVPDGTGVWFGVNKKTFEAGHFARAAMEGVTLGMNYGLRRLAELGVKPTQIRATGGGAKSKMWRQIMADVFDTEVVTLKVSEGAAYGAALQALWCWRLQEGDKVPISDITDQFVELNREETAEPEAKNAEAYRELQGLQDDVGSAARRLPEAPAIPAAVMASSPGLPVIAPAARLPCCWRRPHSQFLPLPPRKTRKRSGHATSSNSSTRYLRTLLRRTQLGRNPTPAGSSGRSSSSTGTKTAPTPVKSSSSCSALIWRRALFYGLNGSRLLGDERPDWYGGDPRAGTKRALRLLDQPNDALFINSLARSSRQGGPGPNLPKGLCRRRFGVGGGRRKPAVS